jgi:ketosteroid isomerase-like protein
MSDSTHPDTNIELVKEGYERFWNEEFDAFFELFTEDFEWIVSEGFPYAGQY